MDRDGVWASVIYGPNLFGLPIAGSGAEGRVARGVQRLGGGVQSRTTRRACPCCRCCRRTRRRPRPPSSSASRAPGHRGAIISPFEFRCSDPAWERFWDVGGGGRAAGQLPHRPRHVAGARRARELGAGRVLRGRADAARRAARHDDLLGRARAPSEAAARARRVRHRLAAVLRQPHGRGGREARRRRRRTTASRRSRARSSAARSTPPSRRSRSARSCCRCSAPTTSCGRPTTRTPTARSRTRARRSRTRSRAWTPSVRRARDGDQLQAALRVRLSRDGRAHPVVIEAAINGATPKSRNPHVPTTPDEIAARCARVHRRPARRSSTTTSTTSR